MNEKSPAVFYIIINNILLFCYFFFELPAWICTLASIPLRAHGCCWVPHHALLFGDSSRRAREGSSRAFYRPAGFKRRIKSPTQNKDTLSLPLILFQPRNIFSECMQY